MVLVEYVKLLNYGKERITMKTAKYLICILLILAMATFLFAGFGKNNTTFRGTWLWTKIVSYQNDKMVYEIEFPQSEEDQESRVSLFCQPYYHFKNNMTLYMYMKLEVPVDLKEIHDDLATTCPVYGELLNGMFLNFNEYEYTESGNKIILVDKEVDKPAEFIYIITDKNMTMTYEFIDENENVCKEVYSLKKVSDLAVENGKTIQEFLTELLAQLPEAAEQFQKLLESMKPN